MCRCQTLRKQFAAPPTDTTNDYVYMDHMTSGSRKWRDSYVTHIVAREPRSNTSFYKNAHSVFRFAFHVNTLMKHLCLLLIFIYWHTRQTELMQTLWYKSRVQHCTHGVVSLRQRPVLSSFPYLKLMRFSWFVDYQSVFSVLSCWSSLTNETRKALGERRPPPRQLNLPDADPVPIA